MACLMLAAPDAFAGSYSAPTYTGGALSPSNGTTPVSYFLSQGTDTSGPAQPGTCDGPITVLCQWQPAAGEAAPQSAISVETAHALWAAAGTSKPNGSCTNGLGSLDPEVANPVVQWTPTSYKYGGSSGGTRYMKQTPNGQGDVTFSVTPQATSPSSMYGDSQLGAHVDYSVSVTPVTINLNGTTPDTNGDGGMNILVGQQCKVGLSGIPSALLPYTTYAWSVSGTTFQSWTVTQNLTATPPTSSAVAVLGPGPLTNSTASWYWNDLSPTQETVKCTATVTPPTGQGAAFNVTTTKTVSVQVPSFNAVGVGGYMQVNKAKPDDTTHNNLWAGPTAYELLDTGGSLPGGMNWQATLTTPTTPAFGTGSLEMVQLVSPNNSYTTVAAPVVTVNDPANKYPMSLDGTYPYGNIALEVAGSSNPIYRDNDSPGLQLDGTNVLATAKKDGAYTDYLMYMPPVASGSTSTWVLLSTFNWTANGSAAMPGNKDGSPLVPGNDNWSFYTSPTGASDSAGAVTPPGSNPPQDSLPTPIAFMPVTTPNTFPQWTHVNAGGTF